MEIDKVTTAEHREPKGWLNMAMFLKLTKKMEPAKAFFVAMMVMEEYAEQRGSPVKGDPFSLIKLVRKYASTILELSEVEKMRPQLLRLIFDEDQAGCWTPKPGLFSLKMPEMSDE